MLLTNASFLVFGLLTALAAASFVAVVRRSRAKSAEIADCNRSLQATFGLAGVGHVHVDLEGRWILVNDRFCEMTGYRRDELLAMSAEDLTHPDDRARLFATRREMLSGDTGHASTEKRYVRKDGSILWAHATAAIVRDASGRPDFFVGIIADIGARKEAEAQLAGGGAQYRAIFDSAVEAMAVIDLEGTIQSANPAVERIFGHAPAELLGSDIKMLMPEASGRHDDSFLQRYRGTGKRKAIGIGPAVVGRRKNGTDFPLDLSVAEWSRSGKVFLTCVMRDVTARMESQAALAASEAHFAAVYAQPGAGVAETDLLRRFVSANDRYCEIVGRSRAELLTLGMKDIVHPDDLHETGPLFDRLMAAAKPFTVEKRYVKPDGSIAYVLSTGSPIQLKDSVPTIVVVVIDITERRKAEAALGASEESLRLLQNEFAHMSRVNDLGEMAAAIAHEINQPLTAISNYLSTSLFVAADGDGEVGFAETEQLMRKASEQAMRAGDIVRRLREFVGKGDGVRTVERVEKLVDAAMALALLDARSTGIAVDREAGVGDAEVEVDAVQIQQVLVNLLRNAVDALAGVPRRVAPRLTISTRQGEDGRVEFIVSDNGPGIAPELTERIFEPFMTTKDKGMGMGLTVCRRLVESHGGTIHAESAPGAGATFKVRLPRFRPILG